MKSYNRTTVAIILQLNYVSFYTFFYREERRKCAGIKVIINDLLMILNALWQSQYHYISALAFIHKQAQILD